MGVISGGGGGGYNTVKEEQMAGYEGEGNVGSLGARCDSDSERGDE